MLLPKFLRRGIDDDSAFCDDYCSAANRLDLFEDMRRDNDAFVFGHFTDKLPHLMFLIGVEAVGRLVEDEYFGVVMSAWARPTRLRYPFDSVSIA
jgi:hypothetical protein